MYVYMLRRLRDDRRLLFEAVRKDWRVLNFASDALKRDALLSMLQRGISQPCRTLRLPRNPPQTTMVCCNHILVPCSLHITYVHGPHCRNVWFPVVSTYSPITWSPA